METSFAISGSTTSSRTCIAAIASPGQKIAKLPVARGVHDILSATRASINVGACVGDVLGDDVGLVVGDNVGSCAVVATTWVQTTRAHTALMSCMRLAIAMTGATPESHNN